MAMKLRNFFRRWNARLCVRSVIDGLWVVQHSAMDPIGFFSVSTDSCMALMHLLYFLGNHVYYIEIV